MIYISTCPPTWYREFNILFKSCVSPIDKGISTYFLHATLLCVPPDIFDLSSWIVRNWDWRETCSLKRLRDRPIGVWEGKKFSRVRGRPPWRHEGSSSSSSIFAGFWVFKNDPKLNWMKATIRSSLEIGLFSNNCFLLYIIMCSTLRTKYSRFAKQINWLISIMAILVFNELRKTWSHDFC